MVKIFRLNVFLLTMVLLSSFTFSATLIINDFNGNDGNNIKFFADWVNIDNSFDENSKIKFKTLGADNEFSTNMNYFEGISFILAFKEFDDDLSFTLSGFSEQNPILAYSRFFCKIQRISKWSSLIFLSVLILIVIH